MMVFGEQSRLFFECCRAACRVSQSVRLRDDLEKPALLLELGGYAASPDFVSSCRCPLGDRWGALVGWNGTLSRAPAVSTRGNAACVHHVPGLDSTANEIVGSTVYSNSFNGTQNTKAAFVDSLRQTRIC